MADLDKFESELTAQHAALTTAFESAQQTAEAAWADAEVKSVALTEFRAKYGKVLKALADGAVKVG